nr:MAG TPA: hypothetical protein [Caudoviricetes sp.]
MRSRQFPVGTCNDYRKHVIMAEASRVRPSGRKCEGRVNPAKR